MELKVEVTSEVRGFPLHEENPLHGVESLQGGHLIAPFLALNPLHGVES